MSSPTAVAGPYPFSDLLFSPRAVFIWNETRRSVAWMNAAARAKFGLSQQDLSKSRPERLTRKFAQVFELPEGKDTNRGTVAFKIARTKAFDCSLEVLKLAGGHDGLIVVELQAIEGDPKKTEVSKLTANRVSEARKPGGKKRSSVKQAAVTNKGAVPKLTAEELRSFKAIGRKVRRLCREKQRAGECAGALKPSPPRGPGVMLSGEHAAQTLRNVLSAFDLVLFLDSDFEILGIEGRAQRLGWRKSSLLGKCATELVAFSEHAIFDRAIRKLAGQTPQIRRETLLARSELGEGAICGAILGRWPSEDAAFFLALLSLKIPHRMKKLQSHAFSMAGTYRLAA
jgi:hypothetical protein